MSVLARSSQTRSRSAVIGPSFAFVDQVDWEELAENGGFGRRDRPHLVKGAVRMWPAWNLWSFARLAELRRPDGSEPVTRFITGVVEQGATSEQYDLPVGPYLRELAECATEAG